MAIIFINYRRTDSSGWTRGLHERLSDAFGADAIFYDVDDINIGENFVSSVVRNLSDCRVFVPVIGPNWLNAADGNGIRRLNNPDDHVRREIEFAMQRQIKIIPVLVGNAVMPDARRLPASIASLSTLNAQPISDLRFSEDMEKLIRGIQGFCGVSRQPHQFAAPAAKKGFSGWSFVFGGIITVGIGFVLLIGLFLVGLNSTKNRNNLSVANSRNSPVAAPENNLTRQQQQNYCEGWTSGVNERMSYARTDAPPCLPPLDLAASSSPREVWCFGHINAVEETAVRQGLEIPDDELKSHYQMCLKSAQ